QDSIKVFPGLGIFYSLAQWLIASGGFVMAALSGKLELARQSVYKESRPTILPIEYALDVLFKDPAKKDQVIDILNRTGLSVEFQELMKISAVAPLGIQEARNAWLRDFISESDHDKILKSNHLSDKSIERLKELYQIIPPVNDIILMAV
ncbi:unnamed protein product, partial [marine sediment metagenome]